MMSHHHKRCNPIERNDIGKKCFRQSRCLRTMEDSDNNQKFNTVNLPETVSCVEGDKSRDGQTVELD